MANPKPLPSSSEQGFSIGGLISKIVNALMQYDEDNTVVVFRYVGSQHPQQEPSGVQTSGEKTEEESNPDGDDLNTNASDKAEQRVVYLDSLNTWLFESLSRDVPSLQLALVLEEIPTEGCTIRFAPAESANMFDVSNDDIDAFIKSLDFHLAILDVTLTQTDTFEQIVNSYDCLRSVHLPDWCGLGAIQYIPSNWIGKLDNLNESGHKDINNINSELVHQLKSSDGAFSLGTSVDQLACVRFGLITPDTKLEDLVQMVFATGRNIEESSKFVESMAEVVRQNIEKANIDLQKEAQEKAYQEGLLRKIPVVGSLMNWWSPSASDAVPRGRTFNLASGKIESTERVYKFHMQLQEADSNKSITQTPLKKKDSLSRGEPPIILPSSTSEAPLSPKSQSELEPKSEEQATKLQRSVSSSGES